MKTIDKFGKQNPSLSVNVFAYEESVYPLRLSKSKATSQTEKMEINLLLISDGEKRHYTLIKNMSRLLAKQCSKKKVKHYFCYNCMNYFFTPESLKKHQEYCQTHNNVKTELPEKGTKLSFTNYARDPGLNLS